MMERTVRSEGVKKLRRRIILNKNPEKILQFLRDQICTACGIRTRDPQTENLMSWTTRRMRRFIFTAAKIRINFLLSQVLNHIFKKKTFLF